MAGNFFIGDSAFHRTQGAGTIPYSLINSSADLMPVYTDLPA